MVDRSKFGQRMQPGQRIYPPPQRTPHFGHARSSIIVVIVVLCIDRRGAAYGCNRNLEHRLRNIGIVSIRDKHALREPLIRPTIAFLRYVANPIKDSLYPFRSRIIARLIYIYIYIYTDLCTFTCDLTRIEFKQLSTN